MLSRARLREISYPVDWTRRLAKYRGGKLSQLRGCGAPVGTLDSGNLKLGRLLSHESENMYYVLDTQTVCNVYMFPYYLVARIARGLVGRMYNALQSLTFHDVNPRV
ncbi:hypothetical protein DPMN_129235 [Dreissena polymorpha]|uniref:Uncharacterized protein n=1 Tax=Dreissena polymorpha TaxID=45954 RepID=A0A9D4H0U2_DREPO|nr:hypothetical protein DPMN_129235 [Dreissena polymorpha]